MPTYDYHCKTCGKNFEWFQSMSSEKLVHCPDSMCEQEHKGEGMVERKIGKGAGLIFNGSGFYLTDYNRSSGTSSAATSASPTSSSSDTTTTSAKSEAAASPAKPPTE